MRIRTRNKTRWTVLVAALVLVAAIVGSASSSRASLAATTSPQASGGARQSVSPKAIDQHGYPRTFLLYASGPVKELARYDLLVLPATSDIGGLRASNPGGIFLLQPSIKGSGRKEVVHITAPGGAVGWPGATDTTRGGKRLGKIRAVDPEWDLLHNADGSITAMGSVLGWNLAAPLSKGVPAEVAAIFAYAAKKNDLYCTVRIGKPGARKRVPCWNGVHSDNWLYGSIGASWFYGSNLDTDRDGRVDDENTLRRNWSNGLTRTGTLLRSYLPGKIVGGNGAWYRPDLYAGRDPKGWLKASNYTLVEHMQRFGFTTPELFLALARRWLEFPDPLGQPRYMTVLQDATDIDGNDVLWPRGDPNTPESMARPDVLRSMRWGLTLSLMTGVYYELRGDYYGPVHGVRWWFDEYDGGVGIRRRGYLGQPLGPYTKLADGVYRRDFVGGIALNNSSSKAATIALKGTFRKLKGAQDPVLNDGSTVTSVTIPPKDGLVLLRIR